jgi:hypothetical protein
VTTLAEGKVLSTATGTLLPPIRHVPPEPYVVDERVRAYLESSYRGLKERLTEGRADTLLVTNGAIWDERIIRGYTGRLLEDGIGVQTGSFPVLGRGKRILTFQARLHW